MQQDKKPNIGDPIGESLILGLYRAGQALQHATAVFEEANARRQLTADALYIARERYDKLRTYLTEVNFLAIAEAVVRTFDRTNEPEETMLRFRLQEQLSAMERSAAEQRLQEEEDDQ